MLVDMEKGSRESGIMASRDQLKKKKCTLEHFYKMPVTRLEKAYNYLRRKALFDDLMM